MSGSSDQQAFELLDMAQTPDGNPFAECNEDSEESEREQCRADGINVWQTALSISGGTAGFGFLAVELLVVSTGWLGFALFCLIFAAVVFTSVLLGRCWNIVRDRWGSERHPYGAIGYEAFGCRARSFINFLVAGSSFTGALGTLLAFTEITMIIGSPALDGTFCYWPVVYGIIMCPFFWLGTPKDFWWILATSFFTVVLSVLLILISVFVNGSYHASGMTDSTTDMLQESQLLHLVEMAGTLIWLLGLHATFPTVQQDMQQPQSFSKAIVLANLFTFLMVVPVMLAIYIVYGNIITTMTGDATVFSLLPMDALKTSSAALLLVHQAGCVLLANNPLFQYLEEVLDLPTDFSWKRVALRSSVLLAQVFVQETLPHFTLVTTLCGGLLIPLLAFMMPCLCYLRLRKTHQNNIPKTSLLETAVCLFIIGTTPIVMAVILLVTGSQMAGGQTVFTAPCYVNATVR